MLQDALGRPTQGSCTVGVTTTACPTPANPPVKHKSPVQTGMILCTVLQKSQAMHMIASHCNHCCKIVSHAVLSYTEHFKLKSVLSVDRTGSEEHQQQDTPATAVGSFGSSIRLTGAAGQLAALQHDRHQLAQPSDAGTP